MLTLFGWAICGEAELELRETSQIMNSSLTLNQIPLEEQVKMLLRRELIINSNDILRDPLAKGPATRDAHAMRQISESIRFDDRLKRYVVGLPWKTSREETAKIFAESQRLS